MKTAFVILARDKVQHVGAMVASAFDQVWDVPEPLEILLSDQGSTDGTRELLDQLAAAYQGPHHVRRIDCPRVESKGIAGLNAHIGWAITQTDAEVLIHAAADDLVLPDLCRQVHAGFASGADMVVCGVLFAKPGQEPHSQSSWQRPGFATVAEVLEHKVGGASPAGWRRSFLDKVGALPTFAGCDVYLPPLAAAMGGLWCVPEPLYIYVEHADVNNMGFEGVLRALETEAEKLPVLEHIGFQLAHSYFHAWRRLGELGLGTEADRDALAKLAWTKFGRWLRVREEICRAGLTPARFPI